MFFEALVINTDTFFERGTIIVRISKFYLRKMQWDLTENYPDFMEDNNEDAEGFTEDYEAYVYSPYGGGSNFGTFFLPQVNQRGLVTPLDKHLKKFVWMGSFFKPERDENWDVTKVDVPSNDMNKEGPEGYGVLNAEPNMLENEKETNFVARFKTTDKSSVEGLTWEDRPTSNIVSIGDNSFFITHFSKDNGWDDEHTPKLWTTYKMEKDENDNDITELKRTDVENEKEQRLALAFIDSKESFVSEIKNNKDDKSSKILQNESNITINIDDGGDEYSFNLSSEDGEMKIVVNNNNEIILNKDGELKINLEDKLELNSGGDIIINPDGTVTIGSNGTSFVARYDELKKIIEKLEKHIHVAPTGPTSAALESNMAPISPGIMQDKRNMESKILETE